MRASTFLLLGLTVFVLLATGAQGGPRKPVQGPLEISPQTWDLAVGDKVRLGKGITLTAVRYEEVVGAYFSGKNTSVFYAIGKARSDIEVPTGGWIGKLRADDVQPDDYIRFPANPALSCRVNSGLGGALCTFNNPASSGSCMLEVTVSKLNQVKFKSTDSSVGKGEAFEKC